MRQAWGALWCAVVWAQGWEPLRDSLLIENERIESLDLDQRPLPVLPSLERPIWRGENVTWQDAPHFPVVLPASPQPARPTWTKLAPLHIRYDVGRFWTQRVSASWGRTRDIGRDEGIALSHSSTPLGHVPWARWGHTYLQAWAGRYTSRSALEIRYRGGYEKFFFYAPYAEGWAGFSEREAPPDSLRGHYWRQELHLAGRHKNWGSLSLSSRRLDFAEGVPEWQAQLTAETRSYALSQGIALQGTLTAFTEGRRYVIALSPKVGQDKVTWRWGLGLRVGLGRDSVARFLLAPIGQVCYKGFSPALQPYVEVSGDMRPLTYFTASELNPYLRRRSVLLPLMREWIRAQGGLQGQGAGWEYRLGGEYRYGQHFLLYAPIGLAFEVRGLPSLQSVGLMGEGRYLPQAIGPYVEVSGGLYRWYLPTGETYYSVAPWEATFRGGYRWEDKAACRVSLWAIGPRPLSDTVQAPPFVDISWEAHVRLWPFLSFFVEMNNLLNKRFYRWHGYRERPIDFRLGIWLKMG